MTEMTHEQAVAQLRDIRGLDVTFWQALLAWLVHYGLYALAVAAVVGAGWYGWRRWQRRKKARWQAWLLEELNALEGARLTPKARGVRVVEVMKKTALMRYPRAEVAALHGREWAAWLESHARSVPEGFRWAQCEALLARLPYMPDDGNVPVEEVEALRRAAVYWIEHLGEEEA